MTATPHYGTRRKLLRDGVLLATATLIGAPLSAQTLAALEVASAGSVKPMLDGPFKTAIASSLHLDLHSHSQGADAVAKTLVDGTLIADVFIPITAGPMRTVQHAGKAGVATPIARTEMVLMYSPKSPLAPRLEAAAAGHGNWWEILQEPGLRLSRSNPAEDPGGRNIIFTLMMAAKKYHQPKLVETVLGPILNPAQIGGGNAQARLQSGDLDVSISYGTAPGFAKLPFLPLPADINLSSLDLSTEHPDISLTLDGKTFYPDPLVFYAAVLKNAPNPQAAAAFLQWLLSDEAQTLLRQNHFSAPGKATPLQV